MKRVLVSGADGFVGSHLVESRVRAGGIRDPHGVRTAMKDCDAVPHLAALIAIPYSSQSPGTYVEASTKGTLNPVQPARALAIVRVIRTSPGELCGVPARSAMKQGVQRVATPDSSVEVMVEWFVETAMRAAAGARPR